MCPVLGIVDQEASIKAHRAFRKAAIVGQRVDLNKGGMKFSIGFHLRGNSLSHFHLVPQVHVGELPCKRGVNERILF